MAKYLKNSQPEMSGSRALRGGLFMMSRSGGLKPKAVAGNPSVTKFTQSSWTGISASGKPRSAVKKMLRAHTQTCIHGQTHTHTAFQCIHVCVCSYHTTSPTLEEIRYLMNCFMLL